jgi:hypothetical protein
VGAAGCADVPDYDDPRDVPLENEGYVSCDNLLANGNFDSTPVGWNLSTTELLIDERQLSAGHPFSASSGYYFAWLGGANSATRSASQRIQVPHTSALTLVGEHFVAAETTSGRIEDTLRIEIVSDTGAILATVASLSNLDSIADGASFYWKDLRSQIASSSFAGKSVTFRITAVTDGAYNTNFLFDTLELKPADCL